MDTSVALGLQPMAKINNEQRNAFAEIVSANGRASEFYQKYGQSAIVKNRTKAQAILDKMIAVEGKVKTIQETHTKAVNAMEVKTAKAIEAVKRGSEKYEDELDTLGYHTTEEGYGKDRKTVLSENTSRTNAEYEMFKKRALATIWGADTLEQANQAIQDYLDLKK